MPRVATDPAINIVALRSNPAVIAALSEILIETVANGGSVSFMHPLAPDVAAAFWTNSLAAADAGERVVLGAMEDGQLVATVTLHLDCPPNQPHRGEIAKMMTRVSRRGRGIARALMLEAERRRRTRPHAAHARHRHRRRRRGAVREARLRPRRRDSRLRPEAPRRPSGHHPLLEAAEPALRKIFGRRTI